MLGVLSRVLSRCLVSSPQCGSELQHATYDPSEACETVYVSARDATTLNSYVVPALETLQMEAQATQLVELWAQELFSDPSINTTALAVVPQAVSPAISFTSVDLRPYGPPQVTPWVSVALIYLIIIAFFSLHLLHANTYAFHQRDGRDIARCGSTI